MFDYKATIGIEVHVELKTKSKVFSNSFNDYKRAVNTSVNVIDLGYPGVLPIVNDEVINYGIKTCFALQCDISRVMHFDRKNYYYPDLPKGYQITQARTPIGLNGLLKVNDSLNVRIHDVHIEEDTCKSLHTKSSTLLNYNRAGVPLLEIVSEPDMHTKEDAMNYLDSLRMLLLYLGVSDCKMEEGSMRADVNVSVSKSDDLGTRTETKNIGSIKDVGIAIDYEIKRQIDVLENGDKITEETRKFDKTTSSTVLMRKKEVGNDYRYFPEPDIPYLYLTDEIIDSVTKDIKYLPFERKEIYLKRGILLVNVLKLLNNKELSDYLNMFIDTDIDFKVASNILLSDISQYLNKESISIFDTKLSKDKFISVVNMLANGDITSKIFKDICLDVLTKDLSVSDILKENNIVLNNDTDELDAIIMKVLDSNKVQVDEYKNGKGNAIKYLMGQVMKEVKGSFNPKIVNERLNALLSK